MPKFRFRLDSVLDHRQRLEDQQQIVFAAAIAAQLQAEAQRDDYIARRTEMRERLYQHHGKMESIELRATYAHCDFLDRSIVEAQAMCDRARAKADEERAKLIVKTKDKKILSTLKERQREAFEFEANAAEQRESDEQNNRHYDRVLNARETPS